jgi:hypothetical protein
MPVIVPAPPDGFAGWTQGETASLASGQGPATSLDGMRHTEFWKRMEHALGASYARTWAEQQVLASLGHRTVSQALEAGEPPKEVWRAVWERLGLPASER